MEKLPKNIPLFPLPGALLLPNSRLPLNIFEPRYIRMVEDTLATKHRLIGMIQPIKLDKRNELTGTNKFQKLGVRVGLFHLLKLKTEDILLP